MDAENMENNLEQLNAFWAYISVVPETVNVCLMSL